MKRILLTFFTSMIAIYAMSQPLDAAFKEQILVSNLKLPNGITFDKNGLGYIWEMEGLVKILDTTDQILDLPFIDLTEEVAKWLDNGLLGFELHPDFPETPYVYLLYTVDLHHHNYFGTTDYDPSQTEKKTATFGRITRFEADPLSDYKSIIPESRKILLGNTIDSGFPIVYDSHGVGSLVFCKDGTLLASCGDSASSIDEDLGSNPTSYFQQALDLGIIRPEENVGAFRSQMMGSLAGKIIRIDAETGEGISSNPYFDTSNADAARSKVWASGLRNGFRFTVQAETGGHFPEEGNPGRIFIGDVGNNAWEELNLIDKGGANLGWPIYEGFFKSTYADKPVSNLDISNPLANEMGCSEHFLFTDLLQEDNLSKELRLVNPCNPKDTLGSSYLPQMHHRPLLSYRNSETDSLPVAFFSEYLDSGEAVVRDIEDYGLSSFEGVANTGGLLYEDDHFPQEFHGSYFMVDFSGWIKTLEFNELDEIVEINDFYEGGNKLVNLNVNPKNGALYLVSTSGRISKISYGGNLPPEIIIESDNLYGPSPLSIQFDASKTSDESEELEFEWSFGDGSGGDQAQVSHTFVAENNEVKNFTVTLKVTDDEGAFSTVEMEVSVNNSPPDVAILSPEDGARYPLDQTHQILLKGTAADAQDESQDLSYEWQTYLHHETHFHEDLNFQTRDAFLITSPIDCVEDVYWYRVRLEVSDKNGLTGQDEIEIFPNCDPEKLISAELMTIPSSDGVILNANITNLQEAKLIKIQRGFGYENLSTIESVNVGLISNLNSFSFLDDIVPESNLVYRLKFITPDGDWYYSNLSQVEFSASKGSSISPIPSEGTITVFVEKVTHEKVGLKIFDVSGQLISSHEFNAVLDGKFEATMDLSSLANGIYYYDLVNADQDWRGKFMIMK